MDLLFLGSEVLGLLLYVYLLDGNHCKVYLKFGLMGLILASQSMIGSAKSHNR